jgi:hypothetical protein
MSICDSHIIDPKDLRSDFLLLSQAPDKNNVKGGKIYLDSLFQRFQFLVHLFGPKAKLSIMAVGACEGDCSRHGSQETEERRRGQGKI